MKIKQLPEEVINKIAAGEVVEAPSSVVKELVENSLDARSTFIKINIEDAGLKKILVEDNGDGMTKDDVNLSIKPHTTSKIANDQDLLSINSFGFRGEALSSIAAVSKMIIKSKSLKDKKGSLIEVENGNIVHTTSLGLPQGTSVIIEDLFGTVPARKKFIRNRTLETKNIIEVITKLAIASTKTGFILINNDKTAIELQPDQKLDQRIKLVLGESLSSELIPIKFDNDQIKIHGYIGKPLTTFNKRRRQLIFVNNRPVENVTITTAVRHAYESLLSINAQPVFILFVEISPDLVDVNIHPRKTEVKFVQDQSVYEFVKTAVQNRLSELDIVNSSYKKNKNSSRYLAKMIKETVEPWSVKKKIPENLEVLQIHDLYLVMETSDGMIMIDQHAAHERILYEQFLAAFRKSRKHKRKHKLEKPVVFDLPLSDVGVLTENIKHFNELGFVIEEFGERTFKISCVPSLFIDRDIIQLIQDVLEDLVNDNEPDSIDEKTRQTLSYLACRSAIKAGDKLNSDEKRELIKKLMQTKTNYTCPHGRPVQMEISKEELERMFKRR